MKRAFSQPVSMSATAEQFESDLRKPLEKMGYETKSQYLSNMQSVQASCFDQQITCSTRKEWHSSGFYYVNGYNPDLFLAIAAQSHSDEFFPGEWAKCVHKQRSGRITMDGLYQVVSHISGVVKLSEPFDDSHSYSDAFFKRPSISELTAHFTKQEPVKEEKWEPENGEMIEFSWEGEWFPGVFIGMHESLFVVQETNVEEVCYSAWSEVRKAESIPVSLSDLIASYAEKNGLDKDRIKVL